MEATMHPASNIKSQNEMAEAIRAWFRGEPLSPAQIDLVDHARRAVLGRALGLHQ